MALELGAVVGGRWQPTARLSVDLGFIGYRRLGLDPLALSTEGEEPQTDVLARWATELQLGIAYGPF